LGLTLHGVEERSKGRFKPSVLGSYERGERAISVDRFCELAQVYSIPADRLLADAFARLDPKGREEVVIDLTRLELVEEPSRELVTTFVRAVTEMRGDRQTAVVTLRSGDIEAIALEQRIRPGRLLSDLRPAILD
jgi:transcriptional regulator with XRE-family HTH domain